MSKSQIHGIVSKKSIPGLKDFISRNSIADLTSSGIGDWEEEIDKIFFNNKDILDSENIMKRPMFDYTKRSCTNYKIRKIE